MRNGWYSTLGERAPRVAAVRSGGVLTGISALHEVGAWILDPPARVHVAVPAHSSARPSDERVVLHWEDASAPPTMHGVAALADALVRAALDEPLDISVPCFDWAMVTNRLDRVDIERILLRLPPPTRRIGALLDTRSQSVLESAARVRLRVAGWRVRSQVGVGLLDAIDLVIEDQVALELDGREFHETTFERDRRKDLAIAIEGRHAIRISHSMLTGDWSEVERAITAALAARDIAGKSGELPEVARRKLRARGLSREVT